MFVSLREAWARGTAHELEWWLGQLRRKAADGQADPDFAKRLAGEAPFPFPALVEHIERPALRVLDIGSGPVSQLGTVLPGRSIELVAVDPLAEQYAAILQEVGLAPKHRPRPGQAETLDTLFGAGEFDFAYCRNALDHACDPLEGISQVIRTLRPGCWFYLCGHAEEGVNAGYAGLHQWNFTVREGELLLWRPGIEIALGKALRAEASLRVEGGRWYQAWFRKHDAA
jgi:SAM-dependent methyltransferase